ncbi:DUF5134 domain-containing protein [Streptomyces sp. B-S-A8]|uniref:DUF5134 domain-containing protein n=1 Tax=Streptomyces solicavernae TaxID=3043614 RepID=A0ABT6RUX5_9ACTN|nr:DUF5134 domain-containing protein [Streptomyces sp. B-S-A8]MDI3387984.1 DUF5134 domain-containing protein [Streptomyces sp. B-S-A8]
MHGSALAGWLLVALCTATGAYCLLRMRSPVAEERSAAGGEALMGFGMALMAVPAAVFGPPAWVWWAYGTVFGAAAVRALWKARGHARGRGRARGRGHARERGHARGRGDGCAGGPAHHLHHLVGALAMVYMSVAMAAAPAGGAGHAAHPGPGGFPLVTGVLLLYFAGYVLRTGVRLVPAAAGAGPVGAVAWGDRAELALACRLAMGIGMFAMLLTV